MDWIFHIAMLLRTREVKGRRWLQFAYSTPDFLVLGVAGGFPKRAGIVIESDQGTDDFAVSLGNQKRGRRVVDQAFNIIEAVGRRGVLAPLLGP
jgi:hypothetical protein